MGGVAKIFKPSKPKKDKEAEEALARQLADERKKAESADRALMSSRRARNAGGGQGRTGLAYVTPGSQGSTLG